MGTRCPLVGSVILLAGDIMSLFYFGNDLFAGIYGSIESWSVVPRGRFLSVVNVCSIAVGIERGLDRVFSWLLEDDFLRVCEDSDYVFFFFC